jgi:hypothetical protein
MTALATLLLLAFVTCSYLSGSRKIRQAQEDAETDAFVDEIRAIKTDAGIPSDDVAYVHQLATRQLPERAS